MFSHSRRKTGIVSNWSAIGSGRYFCPDSGCEKSAWLGAIVIGAARRKTAWSKIRLDSFARRPP